MSNFEKGPGRPIETAGAQVRREMTAYETEKQEAEEERRFQEMEDYYRGEQEQFEESWQAAIDGVESAREEERRDIEQHSAERLEAGKKRVEEILSNVKGELIAVQKCEWGPSRHSDSKARLLTKEDLGGEELRRLLEEHTDEERTSLTPVYDYSVTDTYDKPFTTLGGAQAYTKYTLNGEPIAYDAHGKGRSWLYEYYFSIQQIFGENVSETDYREFLQFCRDASRQAAAQFKE